MYIGWLLCANLSIYYIVKNKGSLYKVWALHNSPKPHRFASLPLESGFSMYEFITTLRFVFSSEYFKTLISIVFNKAFFYYCFKKFFTVKTGIFICISITISLVIKFLFIQYGIHNPLFEYPALYSSCIGVTSSFLRFIKECFEVIWEIHIDMKKEFLDVEGLSAPLSPLNSTTDSCTAHMVSKDQGGPSDYKVERSDIPSNDKINKLKTILGSDVFKTADKLKRLAEVEDSLSIETNSQDTVQLSKWETYVSVIESIKNNDNLNVTQKADAVKALRNGLLYSSREPLVTSTTTANLRSELEGSTVDRRRTVGPTETVTNTFESPASKPLSKLKNFFKKKD